MPVTLTDDEFERAIEAALDSIPEGFLDAMENLVVTVCDEPDEEVCEGEAGDIWTTEDGDVLGLYDGLPITERGTDYGSFGDYPDVITIFKGPHERISDDKAEVLEEVRKTVIHEVAHYFGMDEDQVDAMGYA